MPKESMTPRERWLAVLQRRKPDRIPMDYWATAEVDQKLMRHYFCNDIWEVCKRLHVDRVVVLVPAYAGPPPPPGIRYASFGLKSFVSAARKPPASII